MASLREIMDKARAAWGKTPSSEHQIEIHFPTNDDQLVVSFEDGNICVLEIVDQVYPDRTCGQWDTGVIARCGMCERDFFVSSDSGMVYPFSDDDTYDDDVSSTPIGVCTEWKEKADAYNAMLDELWASDQSELDDF